MSALSERSESKGFTLIELMITVSIISILAVVGVAIYSGAQKNARDAKRRGDIDAIAKALEQTKLSNNNYIALTGSSFQSGVVPTSVFPGQPYCIGGSDTTTSPAVPSAWGSPGGAAGNSCAPNPPYTQVNADGSNMLSGGLNVSWRICSVLESPANTVYCRANQL